MRRSTALAKAVSEAIAALDAVKGGDDVKADLTAALAAYRTRPEGEPEVKDAKAKAEAKA